MNLKRLKQLYKLTKKDSKAIELLSQLTPEQVALIPDETKDEKAEFFGSGNEKEYQDFLREEDGTKPWYQRLKDL